MVCALPAAVGVGVCRRAIRLGRCPPPFGNDGVAQSDVRELERIHGEEHVMALLNVLISLPCRKKCKEDEGAASTVASDVSLLLELWRIRAQPNNARSAYQQRRGASIEKGRRDDGEGVQEAQGCGTA